MEKVINEVRQQLILIESAVEGADMSDHFLKEALACSLLEIISKLTDFYDEA